MHIVASEHSIDDDDGEDGSIIATVGSDVWSSVMRFGLSSRPQLRPWSSLYIHHPNLARNASSTPHDRAPSPRTRDAHDAAPTFELGDEETKSFWTTQGRHLLRAILRECTYLPDPHAQEYIRHYAISRFRKYAWRLWKDDDVEVLGPRLAKKRKEARQFLSLLKLANEGNGQKLTRVLLLTYGRAGRRRREWLAPLLTEADHAGGDRSLHPGGEAVPGDKMAVHSDSTETSDMTDPSTASRQGSKTPSFDIVRSGDKSVMRIRPKLSPMLEALVHSQISVDLPQNRRPSLRSLTLDIPRLNSWHQPMPQKRIKNMILRWKAELFDRVHAPLPTAEWHRLHSLATGQERARIPIPCRKRVGQQEDAEAHVPSAALTALVVWGTISTRPTPRRERTASTITPRAMRRLWDRILQLCPRMDWDAGQQRWDVTWASSRAKDGPT